MRYGKVLGNSPGIVGYKTISSKIENKQRKIIKKNEIPHFMWKIQWEWENTNKTDEKNAQFLQMLQTFYSYACICLYAYVTPPKYLRYFPA